MSDLFHEDVSLEYQTDVFEVMARSRSAFQVLTKRAEIMLARIRDIGVGVAYRLGKESEPGFWPLPNVWLGVSCEDQKTADERIPHLLRTPAAVRFVSAEPLLGPIDFTWFPSPDNEIGLPGDYLRDQAIRWLIVGGESGPHARPCRPQWIRSIVRQCQAANVPVFVKQLGGNVVTRNDMVEDEFNNLGTGWPDPEVEHDIHGFREEYQGADCRIRLRDKKGGDMEEWPRDLRIREMPHPKGVPA